MDEPVIPPQPNRTPILIASAISGLVFLILGFLLGRRLPAHLPFSDIPEPLPTSASTLNSSLNWKTYIESNLNYSFQYPPASCEPQRELGDTTFVLCYLPKGSDGGAKHNMGYVITLGFISQGQLNVMGITYCGAYPNDSSRCESFKTGKVTASIDWGTGNGASANAGISHPNGGIVTFDLLPVTAESKEILKQILSTFKFTNQPASVTSQPKSSSSKWVGLGVSFNYPTGWVLNQPVSNVQKPQSGGFYQQSFTDSAHNTSLLLSVRPRSKNPDGTLKSLDQETNLPNTTAITLAGQPATKSDYSDSNVHFLNSTTFLNDSTLVSLHVIVQPADTSSVAAARASFDQILSTFQFSN